MLKLRYKLLSTVLLLFMLAVFSGAANGQFREDIKVVEVPTAGIIPHKSYMYSGSVGPFNSLLFGLDVGLHDRLMMGGSFGLQNFIGRGEIDYNERPEFRIRLRLLEEIIGGPALAVGVNTQGQNQWFEDLERYERKSRGFYAVFSKGYRLWRRFSLHFGMNYSMEDEYEDGTDLFGGVTIETFPGLMVLCEYSAGFNDDDEDNPHRMTRGRGYLDMGVRFDYRENLRIRVNFQDLMENYIPESGVSRSVEISYINFF